MLINSSTQNSQDHTPQASIGSEGRVDPQKLHDILHYEPKTGIFTWKVKRRRCNIGDPAGCIYRLQRTNSVGVVTSQHSYLVIHLFGVRIYLHRLAFIWMTGNPPKGFVDHIDGDGLNNRWCNLREATPAQNRRNSARQHNNRSGFKGVYRHQGKWTAVIQVGGRKIYGGSHVTPEQAASAYAELCKKHYGEFGRVA